MRRAAHLQYLQYVVLGFLGGVECVTFLEEPHQYRLERTLFSGYKPHLRPVLDPNTTTNITYTLVITAVHELDEMHQTLVHSSYLSLSWMDQLLVWDPGQYGDIRWLEVPTEMIWTPNLMFVNSASNKRSLEPDMSRFAFINSSGRVGCAPFAVRTTSCSMDITFYPFDSQVCVVTLESWSSPESEMNVTEAEVKLDEWYMANSEWKLEEVAVEDVESMFEGLPYARHNVVFRLKRRRLFHTLTVVLPNVLLALLVSLVFCLPAGAGEKMSFSMSLLLAFAVNLSVLLTAMPRSSLHVSVLMMYITGISVVTALSVVTSVWLLRLYHKDDDPISGQTVGPNLSAAILFLRKLFRLTISSECKTTQAHRTPYLNGQLNNGVPKDENFSTVENTRDAPKDNLEALMNDGEGQTTEFVRWRDAAVVLDYVFFRTFIFVIFVLTALLIGALFSRGL